MAFEKGDPVFVKQGNEEVSATFDVYITGPDGKHSSAYILVNDKREQVDVKDLLAQKKPGFGIRDLVLINDEHRDAVQGEVIAIGHGPKGQQFYQLRFAPNSGHAVSWYSEDEVFIESAPKLPLKISENVLKVTSR
jgi:hypothetical protein